MSFSLTGLASGLDTATIISQLMQIERIPYQKLEQRQNTLSSQQSIFRNINTKLSALRTAAEELSMSFNFDLRSTTVSDESVVKATASEGVPEGSYVINVESLATRHSLVSKKFSNLGEELNETLKITIAVGDESDIFTIDPDPDNGLTVEQALDQLRQKINASELDVTASLITTDDSQGIKRLVITSNKTGTANSISIDDENNQLEFEDSVKAEDAIFKVNGVEIKSSSNEISEVIPGLSLTLMKAGETTIHVQRDVDKIVEKVEAFVKAYNDVISTVKSNLGKEKSLQGDSTLRTLESHLNNLINRQVGNDPDALSFLFQIGLEVDKGKVDASSMTGTISFDKEKFKSAFAANPDEVIRLFTYQDKDHPDQNGIAVQFKNSLMEWTSYGKGILAMKIEGYTSEISLINQQMEAMETRLELKEQQLKRQFTAMESALIQLQNQQVWLASQIASMGIY
ncbi:flagellar hook-associated protein 2 [Insulibacter thermoxylanivorax]|uniref:Flagellar hook-associated protein 2 n=1 Tax=Insulibacter thermoxylanivorax TaxID=2749268 RepID=A0A916QEA6_9BACL|nr:flagellar filament capping protein FliD [Insulibacter thermoxylanivorax]GFR39152.1 flagellar hook-associated protein 2 [Insulibacter thermoxylanivorax]